jgi:hypothetical protein
MANPILIGGCPVIVFLAALSVGSSVAPVVQAARNAFS